MAVHANGNPQQPTALRVFLSRTRLLTAMPEVV
jgi:hypothetical protein